MSGLEWEWALYPAGMLTGTAIGAVLGFLLWAAWDALIPFVLKPRSDGSFRDHLKGLP